MRKTMIEDDFARRRREHDHLKSAIPGAPPAVYRVALHKPDPGRKGRLYRIDPIGVSTWRCEAISESDFSASGSR